MADGQSTELVEVSSAIRERAALIPVSTHGLAPRNLAELMDFGQLMAKAGPMVGKAFRGAPGSCVAIAMQAMRWNMDPFAVSQKAYVTQDKHGNEQIGYEAQLINAVVLSNAPMTRRPQYTYSGSGNRRRCKVSIWLRSEPEALEYETPENVPEGRSPLWKNDLDQQLSYFAIRSWARRHMPELLMGVYSIDELQDADVIETRVIDSTGDNDQRPADERVGPYGVIGGQAGRDACDELAEAMSACEDVQELEAIEPQIEAAKVSSNRTFLLNEHYARCHLALSKGEPCPDAPRFTDAPEPSPFEALKAESDKVSDAASFEAFKAKLTPETLGKCTDQERAALRTAYADAQKRAQKSGAGGNAGPGEGADSDKEDAPGGAGSSAPSSPFEALKQACLDCLRAKAPRRALAAWRKDADAAADKLTGDEQAQLDTVEKNVRAELSK